MLRSGLQIRSTVVLLLLYSGNVFIIILNGSNNRYNTKPCINNRTISIICFIHFNAYIFCSRFSFWILFNRNPTIHLYYFKLLTILPTNECFWCFVYNGIFWSINDITTSILWKKLNILVNNTVNTVFNIISNDCYFIG